MLEIKPIFNALRRSKAGAIMLLVQIALTVAIVSNAAFIINDRITYLIQDTGYPEDSIFYFSILNFAKDVDTLQQVRLDETTLRNMPGVINALHLSEVPLSGSGSASSFFDGPDPEKAKGVRSGYAMSDEHAIDTLGLTLSSGRNFTKEEIIVQDDPSKVPTVGVVSKSFADEMFPEGNALNNTLYFGPYPLRIIGIVEKMMGPWPNDRAANNFILFPMLTKQNFQKMVVRTKPSDRKAVMKQIEDVLLASSPERVITQPQGLDDSKDDYNAADILMMRMLVVLIVVLVLVTALGIFGVTVFNINKRTKQIGTRRALGARKSAIVRYFLIENTIVCVFGLVLGSVAAIYLGQALFNTYSLPALDPNYVAVTALFTLIVSLLSVLAPAYKAANISPSVATRSV